MKLILIPPVPELPRLGCLPVTNIAPRFHLLLSHMCEDPNYVAYYQHRRQKGDYLILDNGADELAEGQRIGRTLALAKGLRAQEVVLPDVQWDAHRTLEHSLGALGWLESQPGRSLYDQAGRPRLMVVPQGRTRREWGAAAEKLISHARATMRRVEGPSLVIGVAKQYDSLPGGRTWCCDLLRPHLMPAEDVHLLGWAHRLQDVFDVRFRHPWVRSVDSAKPLVYALNGIKVKIQDNPTYPLRPKGYFSQTFPEGDVFADILAHNLKVFDPA